MVIASPAISSSSPISCSAFCCGCNLLEGEKRSECITRFLRGVSSDCPGASWSMGLLQVSALIESSAPEVVQWRSLDMVKGDSKIFVVHLHDSNTLWSHYLLFVSGDIYRTPVWSVAVSDLVWIYPLPLQENLWLRVMHILEPLQTRDGQGEEREW